MERTQHIPLQGLELRARVLASHIRGAVRRQTAGEDKQPPPQAVIPETVLEMNTHPAFTAYLPAVHEKPVPLTEREGSCSEYMIIHAV